MIDRYSLPEMRSLWSEQRKLQIWLEIEILACEAMAEFGSIPKEDAAAIRRTATFDIENVHEIEKRTNHDVIAFLEDVALAGGPGFALDSPGTDLLRFARHHARGADDFRVRNFAG